MSIIDLHAEKLTSIFEDYNASFSIENLTQSIEAFYNYQVLLVHFSIEQHKHSYFNLKINFSFPIFSKLQYPPNLKEQTLQFFI